MSADWRPWYAGEFLRQRGSVGRSKTAKGRQPERKFDRQIVVGNCAPDCALTGVYPRQTPSLTGKHGERPHRGKSLKRLRKM